MGHERGDDSMHGAAVRKMLLLFLYPVRYVLAFFSFLFYILFTAQIVPLAGISTIIIAYNIYELVSPVRDIILYWC